MGGIGARPGTVSLVLCRPVPRLRQHEFASVTSGMAGVCLGMLVGTATTPGKAGHHVRVGHVASGLKTGADRRDHGRRFSAVRGRAQDGSDHLIDRRLHPGQLRDEFQRFFKETPPTPFRPVERGGHLHQSESRAPQCFGRGRTRRRRFRWGIRRFAAPRFRIRSRA